MGASAALKYTTFNVVLLIPLLGGGPPAQLLVLRQFAAEDIVRWGVWLGRHIC